MANLVITSTTNSVKVDFGVLGIKHTKGVWRKEQLSFFLQPSNAFVIAKILNEVPFAVSWNGSVNTLQIDSVDGVAPTSNSDLFDKLSTIIA